MVAGTTQSASYKLGTSPSQLISGDCQWTRSHLVYARSVSFRLVKFECSSISTPLRCTSLLGDQISRSIIMCGQLRLTDNILTTVECHFISFVFCRAKESILGKLKIQGSTRAKDFDKHDFLLRPNFLLQSSFKLTDNIERQRKFFISFVFCHAPKEIMRK